MVYQDLIAALPGLPHALAVDLSSTDQVLATVCRCLYVGGTGDVKLDTEGGETVTFQSVPAGFYINVRATKVYKTGTTATKIMAQW